MSEARDRDAAVEHWLRHLATVETELPSSEDCLDAETMAAWIDRSLAGPARADADAHVAACARCQTIAATIARTESIAAWSAPDRRPRWRWLTWVVPLSAAATVAAVIVVARRDVDRSRQTAQSVSQVAESRPATTEQQKSAGAREEDERKALRDKAPAPRSIDAFDAVAPKRPAATPSPAAASPPPGRAAGQNAAAVSQARADESARTAEMRPRQAETVELEIRSPNPAVLWRIRRVLPEQVQGFARSAAVVERSIDAGSTWTPTSTGVTANITAGASPAASVCWLVGRAGVVLLTTDGAAWQRLTFPEVTDLSAVRAADARTATITTTDGREFSTTDGGRTWSRRDLQENRTPSF